MIIARNSSSLKCITYTLEKLAGDEPFLITEGGGHFSKFILTILKYNENNFHFKPTLFYQFRHIKPSEHISCV